jgi:hypothetical protein
VPRGLNALLWGVPKLPVGEPPALLSDRPATPARRLGDSSSVLTKHRLAAGLPSEVLPNAGVATLRVRGSDHTLALKFGPHGGGHGHFDKLTFISYANGKHLAVDPGTQAYGLRRIRHGTR